MSTEPNTNTPPDEIGITKTLEGEYCWESITTPRTTVGPPRSTAEEAWADLERLRYTLTSHAWEDALSRLPFLPRPTALTYSVQQGAVRVNSIVVLHRTQESLLLAVDCAHKRPEYSVDYDADEGVLEIILHEAGDASANGRNEQMVAIADGIIDAIYVLAGCGVTLGMPLGKVWDEVQRSNMAKADSKTGKVRRRDDGKILKPEGWAPPDVAKALGLNT